MLASSSVLPTTPSVFAPPYRTPDTTSPSSFEGLSTALPEGAAALAKRQRVTMACQYCRHRKIRCCGGAPCRNCARSQRECEYSPVPEIVNRASREKKAMARAARFGLATPPPGSFPYYSPPSSYSPYLSEASVFDGPFSSIPAPAPSVHFQTPPPHPVTMSAAHARPNAAMSHRRSVSVPNLEAAQSWIEATPAAPQLDSPAQFESPQWMYGSWSPAAAAAAAHQTSTNQSPYPSVFDQPVSHLSLHTGTDNTPYATPSTTHQRHRLPVSHRSSGSGIDEYNHAWSTPPVRDHYSTMTPGMNSSPVSPEFYTPFPTHPNVYQYYSQPPTPSLSYPAPPPRPVFTRHEANAVVNLNCDISPTLAPEMSNSMSSRKSLVGLGIGMGSVNRHTPDMIAAPTMTSSEDYFSVPAAAQGGY